MWPSPQMTPTLSQGKTFKKRSVPPPEAEELFGVILSPASLQLVGQEREGLGRRLQSVYQHLFRPPRSGEAAPRASVAQLLVSEQSPSDV